MLRAISAVRQASINSICTALVKFQIRSTSDLTAHFKQIAKMINEDPEIFMATDSLLQRTELFAAAVAAYASLTAYNIRVSSNIDLTVFKKQETEIIRTTTATSTAIEDLTKVTKSYDQLAESLHINKVISRAIKRVLKNKEYGFCDAIILGAGDTGTTLWLEKYKSQHGATYQSLSEKKLPAVLMIADGFGSWKHDYTLAQTQSSLERSTADKNPSDFLSTEYYQKNPQANGRHVFQANQVCLGRTQAPILHMNMLKIEKKENHSNWQNNNYPYRVIVQFPKGEIKTIYTHNIEVCTGLGFANIHFDEKIIQTAELKKLNQFDSRLGFTPIVDGNQFVLTDSEEQKEDRTIVIYGGGGTASACYRKSFFGNDIRTYDRPYTSDQQKNKVIWIFKDFIGTGKMAANAIDAARARNEVFQGELAKVTQKNNGQLLLEFNMHHANGVSTTQTFLSDQLIYSIGQNDDRARQVCSEVSSDLQVNADKFGMLLNISTPDKKVTFFGAAAVSVRKTEFLKETTKWLDEQNIGGDVGAGSMPPTRAQIKRHLALQNIKPESINANMDSSSLIKEYLVIAGVKEVVIDNFIQDLLLARKHDTHGCSRATLEALLSKHTLHTVFNIDGHAHLVLKGQKKQAKSSTPPMLAILEDDLKSKQTTGVDDMKLGLELGYEYRKPLIVATDARGSSASVSSGATAKPVVPNLNRAFFEIIRRVKSDDSYAFVSRATITPIDSQNPDKATVAQPIQVTIQPSALRIGRRR